MTTNQGKKELDTMFMELIQIDSNETKFILKKEKRKRKKKKKTEKNKERMIKNLRLLQLNHPHAQTVRHVLKFVVFYFFYCVFIVFLLCFNYLFFGQKLILSNKKKIKLNKIKLKTSIPII